MGVNCKYHPTRQAQWECENCDIFLCGDCVEEHTGPEGQKTRFCPSCNLTVDWLGVANIIEPFWKRIPKFFLYPFGLYPLVLNLVLSLLSTLAIVSRNRNILFLVVFATTVAGIKYSFEVLRRTSKGKLSPPAINEEILTTDIALVAKQIGMYIIIAIAFLVVTIKLGPIVGVLFLIFVFLFLPSMIIVLVTTDSLIAALTPPLFVKLAMRIGRGYLLMYFFLILLIFAPAPIISVVGKIMPKFLFIFLFGFIQYYYTIISYHLMGYVILQYHDEIGYDVEFEDFEDPSLQTEEADKDTNLNRLDVLIKEGKLDEAIALCKPLADSGEMNLTISERYFNLLKLKKRSAEMLEHGNALLPNLIGENEKKKACEVYIACNNADNTFAPPGTALLRLGSWLKEAGNPKAAIGAYNKFAKANPKNKMTPKAYFLAAQILNEKMKNPAKAKTILTGLAKKYPNNEIFPYVKDYLSKIG